MESPTLDMLRGCPTLRAPAKSFRSIHQFTERILLMIFGSAFVVNLCAQPDGPLVISSPPHGQIAGVGGQATFSVEVGTSSTPLSYQWQFNGANVPGATNALLTLTNVQTTNAGSYTVVVSNGAGSVSNHPAAILTVPYVFTTI